MEKQTVFIKRYPSKGEFPKFKDGIYQGYFLTEFGLVKYSTYDGWKLAREYPDYWLEEIELPSEEEVKEELMHPVNISENTSTLLRDMYEHGIARTYNFILNKLKGG